MPVARARDYENYEVLTFREGEYLNVSGGTVDQVSNQELVLDLDEILDRRYEHATLESCNVSLTMAQHAGQDYTGSSETGAVAFAHAALVASGTEEPFGTDDIQVEAVSDTDGGSFDGVHTSDSYDVIHPPLNVAASYPGNGSSRSERYEKDDIVDPEFDARDELHVETHISGDNSTGNAAQIFAEVMGQLVFGVTEDR